MKVADGFVATASCYLLRYNGTLNDGVSETGERERGSEMRRYWEDHKDIENADARVERRCGDGKREERRRGRMPRREESWTWKIEQEREREGESVRARNERADKTNRSRRML